MHFAFWTCLAFKDFQRPFYVVQPLYIPAMHLCSTLQCPAAVKCFQQVLVSVLYCPAAIPFQRPVVSRRYHAAVKLPCTLYVQPFQLSDFPTHALSSCMIRFIHSRPNNSFVFSSCVSHLMQSSRF